MAITRIEAHYVEIPLPADFHRHGPAAPRNFRFFGVFNVLAPPVTQVPLGLSAEGLPLGVQVIAGHGRDHLTIAAALELERALGGWLPPERQPDGSGAASASSARGIEPWLRFRDREFSPVGLRATLASFDNDFVAFPESGLRLEQLASQGPLAIAMP